MQAGNVVTLRNGRKVRVHRHAKCGGWGASARDAGYIVRDAETGERVARSFLRDFNDAAGVRVPGNVGATHKRAELARAAALASAESLPSGGAR